MSVTIELTPAEEAALNAAATREGTDVSVFVRERVLDKVFHGLNPDDENLAFVRADSLAAVRAAQQTLLDSGIGYVVARPDGVIVRRFADGREEIIAPAKAVA